MNINEKPITESVLRRVYVNDYANTFQGTFCKNVKLKVLL